MKFKQFDIMIDKIMNNYDTTNKNIDLVCKLFGNSCFDGSVFNSQFEVYELAIEALSLAMNDKYEWIGWYCLETDFGRGNSYKVTMEEKTHSIDTTEKLYKLIKGTL